MRAGIHTAMFICAGSILVALAIALYGNAFPRLRLSEHLQTSSLSTDARLAQASCAPSDTLSEKNDVFFISCGGIY
jgi:hypothetical protein